MRLKCSDENCAHIADDSLCYGCDKQAWRCCRCNSELLEYYGALRPNSMGSPVSSIGSLHSAFSGISVPPRSKKKWPSGSPISLQDDGEHVRNWVDGVQNYKPSQTKRKRDPIDPPRPANDDYSRERKDVPFQNPVTGRNRPWIRAQDETLMARRGEGWVFSDISPFLTTHSPGECRERYRLLQKHEFKSSQARKRRQQQELSAIYKRHRSQIWSTMAAEMDIPWRAAENMHWQVGIEAGMCQASSAGVNTMPDQSDSEDPSQGSPPVMQPPTLNPRVAMLNSVSDDLRHVHETVAQIEQRMAPCNLHDLNAQTILDSIRINGSLQKTMAQIKQRVALLDNLLDFHAKQLSILGAAKLHAEPQKSSVILNV